MKKWERYKEHLETGLWHVHTNYTDGKNSVFEFCQKAQDKGFSSIAFTEHVRKELTYNFDNFLADISKARDKFDIKIIAGCEAGVLDEKGTLDISEEVLKKCEVVFAAFHRPIQTHADYLKAVMNMLQNPNVDAWAHPHFIPAKIMPTGFMIPSDTMHLSVDELKSIMALAAKNNVLIENSVRYQTPEDFIAVAKLQGATIFKGYDAHNVDEI
ncbi:MAG: PHP domain-containing protein [Nanoarchaeota archaeon]